MFLGIFGSLALAVASIGIVNTLVMAILERRREIGIMKAIGASDGDVKKLFFAEAGAMGILGGIVGVALGWAHWPGHQPGNEYLSKAPVFSAGSFLVGTVVAGGFSDCVFFPCESCGGSLPGGTRGPPRSRAGPTLRVN